MCPINRMLTIGIPVRNEEKTLFPFLQSLNESLKMLAGVIDVEVIICVNGSTDRSLELAQKYQRIERREINIIRSAQGKMDAQRSILKSRVFNGPILFLDADIILDKNCIAELWSALVSNENIQVAYAQVCPFQIRGAGVIDWIQRIHYKHSSMVLTPRMYFHGRAYLLRSADVFEIPDIEELAMQVGKGTHGYQYQILKKGPQIDDVYLSRVIAHRFGVNSMQEIQKAKVFFVPPQTFQDFYEGQKRLLIEIRRDDLLFPEHSYLQRLYFGRRVRWRVLLTLPMLEKMHYLLYLLFERGTRVSVKTILFIRRKIRFSHNSFWVPLSSTKNFKGVKNGKDRE